MSKVIYRGADVCPNSLPHQGLHIVPQVGLQQAFHGGPHAIYNCCQVAGLVCRGPLQLLERGNHCPSLRVTQDNDKPRVEAGGGEFDAADL